MRKPALLIGLLLVAFGAWPVSPPLASAQQAPCRFFTEAGEGAGGFAVCDDETARFRSALEKWGIAHIGYPISRRYRHDGFVTQAFQKAIMQWRPAGNYVALVNIFDELHADGFDDRLLKARQTPMQLPDDWDGDATFPGIVAGRQMLLEEHSAFRTTYYSVDNPLALFGLPTSDVMDMGNHYALRLQRTVFQEWKEDVPWARAGQITIANSGDIAKALGALPVAALVPEAVPLHAPAQPPPPEPTPTPVPVLPSTPHPAPTQAPKAGSQGWRWVV
ncbi:MAG: hypothetical protein ACRELV_10205, partial [Longimicrobiales bacterium]